MALLCSGAIFGGMAVRAQTVSCDSCTVPTDDANNVGGTASVPWNPGAIDTTIFGCPVQICYGCRTTNLKSGGTNNDYVVTQICVDSECFYLHNDSLVLGQPDTNWNDWLGQADLELFITNPCHFPCPSNFTNQTFWQENSVSCWKTVISYDPSCSCYKLEHKFCDQHGWCLNQYEIKCDANGFHHKLVNTQVVGYTCVSPCTGITCPPAWPDN